MEYTLYELGWFFFIYSFAGWCQGVALAAARRRTFVNTGVLNLPLCPIYGVIAVSFSIFLTELKERPVFLFVGGMVICAVLTALTGVVLERIFRRKWWESRQSGLFARRQNKENSAPGCLNAPAAIGKILAESFSSFTEGTYVSIPMVLGAGFGSIFVLWFGNPLIRKLCLFLPRKLGMVLLAIISACLLIDLFCVLTVVWKWRVKIRQFESMAENMRQLSMNFGNAITRRVRQRLEKSYPNIRTEKILEERAEKGGAVRTKFAEGCCFYKLAGLFFIGAFMGDLIEVIFCRLTMGFWMSRSSVVYGPFSIIWGFGCAVLTGMLYKYRKKNDRYIFIYGTVLGGAYEYLCSVFTELAFGTVFWDYSSIPFNLGGRVNLLYCFFWGIVAVVWLKGIYPHLSALIEKIPKKIGPVLMWIMILFMLFDVIMSSAALGRYSDRYHGVPAGTEIEEYLDEKFPDERILQIYPKMRMAEDVGKPPRQLGEQAETETGKIQPGQNQR